MPKCHLKPFSLDGKGLAINVYNHSNDKTIPKAAVKGQCAKPYFYGKDLFLEQWFHKIEGHYAGLIRKVLIEPKSLSDDDLYSLLQMAFLQMNRTEANVKRRALMHKGLDELSHKGFEEYRKETLEDSHEKMLKGAIKTCIDARHTIEDLGILVLENQTKCDFITSDDPAVLINRLNVQKLGGKAFGLASSGTQLVMPLTPRHCLICYDKSIYRVQNRIGSVVAVKKVSDVCALNELQLIRSQANVYFRNWADREFIRECFMACRERRPLEWVDFWVGIPAYDQDGVEYYRKASKEEASISRQRIISTNPVNLVPSRWLSVLPFKTDLYGYSNGSAVGYIRRGQVQAMKMKDVRKEKIVFSAKKYEPQRIYDIEDVR